MEELEMAGWKRRPGMDYVWHPRWGKHHIAHAQQLQSKHDMAVGRTVIWAVVAVLTITLILCFRVLSQ